MAYKIESLDLSKLTNAEAGNLITDTITVYGSLPPADPFSKTSPLASFIAKLQNEHTLFSQSRNPVQAQASTPQIEALDYERDQAIKVLRQYIKLGLAAIEAAETNAANNLILLMNKYKDIENDSYQGETENTDKLLNELNAKYSENINTLGLQRYITRLTNANNAFKALYDNRNSQVALIEVYNTRLLRNNMLATYRNLMQYLQVMANLPDGTYPAQILTKANILRKNLADLIARRQGIAQANEKKGIPDPELN